MIISSSRCAAHGTYQNGSKPVARTRPFQCPRRSVSHSQQSRIADVYHWCTNEKFIRKCIGTCVRTRGRWFEGEGADMRRGKRMITLPGTVGTPRAGGSQQSPISVLFAQSEYKYFDPIQFLNYDSYLQIDIEMVQYSFFMGTIHFGKDSQSGSEHFIENQGFAAEVQLIHTTELLNENDCLKEANGLLVLVILFEEKNDDNEDLVPFLDVHARASRQRTQPAQEHRVLDVVAYAGRHARVLHLPGLTLFPAMHRANHQRGLPENCPHCRCRVAVLNAALTLDV
ncbi:hypothetical protein MRX96_018510 [Rhipicephalus microplus]